MYNRRRKEKNSFCPAAVTTLQSMYSNLKDENVPDPSSSQLKKEPPDKVYISDKIATQSNNASAHDTTQLCAHPLFFVGGQFDQIQLNKQQLIIDLNNDKLFSDLCGQRHLEQR